MNTTRLLWGCREAGIRRTPERCGYSKGWTLVIAERMANHLRKSKARRREVLIRYWNSYVSACYLSVGGNPVRRRYWEEKAIRRRDKLLVLL